MEDQLQAGVFRREFAYATVELNCTLDHAALVGIGGWHTLRKACKSDVSGVLFPYLSKKCILQRLS